MKERLQAARAMFLLMEAEVFHRRDALSNAARLVAYQRWLEAVRYFNAGRR